MSKPKELFWVEKKHSPDFNDYRKPRGGKYSSLAAAKESKWYIMNRDPGATVRIYRSDCGWVEVVD